MNGRLFFMLDYVDRLALLHHPVEPFFRSLSGLYGLPKARTRSMEHGAKKTTTRYATQEHATIVIMMPLFSEG